MGYLFVMPPTKNHHHAMRVNRARDLYVLGECHWTLSHSTPDLGHLLLVFAGRARETPVLGFAGLACARVNSIYVGITHYTSYVIDILLE